MMYNISVRDSEVNEVLSFSVCLVVSKNKVYTYYTIITFHTILSVLIMTSIGDV